MKLLIMFAEMERKNIRLRVRDNYYARGENGFYLGGYPPFAYTKTEITIDGKKTGGYEIIECEAEILKEIYMKICYENKSATYLCRYLNSKKITTKKGCPWSVASLTRLIRNPFYVKADWKIYDFFLSQNAVITSLPDDFCGECGCVCYGEKSLRKGGKFKSFKGEHITVGRHKGIISSDLWLEARKKLGGSCNKQVKNSAVTFLSGLVFCESCGKKYTVTSSKGIIYFYCRGLKNGTCQTKVRSVRGDYLEKIAGRLITTALSKLEKTKKKPSVSIEENRLHCEICEQKNRLSQLKNELKVGERDIDVVMEAVAELQEEISHKKKRLSQIVEKSVNLCYTELKELGEGFDPLPCDIKNRISKELITKIEISQGKISIFLRYRKGFYNV